MEIYEFRSKLSSRPRLKRPRAGSWTDTYSSQLTTGDCQQSNSTASESVVSTPTGSEVSQDAAQDGDVELRGTTARDHSTDHRRQKSRFEPILRLWQRCLAHPKVIISAIVQWVSLTVRSVDPRSAVSACVLPDPLSRNRTIHVSSVLLNTGTPCVRSTEILFPSNDVPKFVPGRLCRPPAETPFAPLFYRQELNVAVTCFVIRLSVNTLHTC